MAKFEDYAKKDELSQEIDTAARESENRQADNSSVPERFRGKSVEDVAKSYEELEKAFSRQGNDMGELRKTVDEFIRLQSQGTSTETQEEAKPATVDDLYVDADATIRRVVREEAGSRIEQLEAELARARLNEGLSTLDNKYKGWREEAETTEFRAWVQASPYKIRMAVAADQQGDLTAAAELLDMWYDRKGAADTADRARKLRDAGLESGGTEAVYIDKPFSRAELMAHRVAAKRGDEASKTYLRANADAIAQAYEQGHITD